VQRINYRRWHAHRPHKRLRLIQQPLELRARQTFQRQEMPQAPIRPPLINL
jgi:hypothetical protein